MYLHVFTHVIHINVSIQEGSKGGRGENGRSRGEEEALNMTLLLCFSGSLSPHLPVKTHNYDW